MKNPLPRRIGAFAAASAVMLTLAACGSDDSSTGSSTNTGGNDATAGATDNATDAAPDLSEGCVRPETMTTVVMGATKSLATGPLVFTADELGYFEQENIQIEYQTIANPSDTLTLINSGDIDAAFGGLSAGFFNAIDRGLEIRGAASGYSYPEGPDKAAGIYVRSALKDQVTSIEDLKGLNYGLAGGTGDLGNAGGFLTALVLKDAGLTLDDLNIVNVGRADNEVAFNSGAIDAAFVPSPYSTMLEESGAGFQLDTKEILANQSQGGLVFGPKLNEETPEVGVALIRALARVAQDKLRPGYSQDQEVIDALAAHEIEQKTLQATPEYAYDPEMKWVPESIEAFQQTFIDYGNGVLTYDTPKPVAEVTNDALREAAVASIANCTY